MKKNLIYIVSILVLSGCDLLVKKETRQIEEGELPLAEVLDKKLYYSDIEGIEGNTSKEDSAAIVNQYINMWVLRQLLTVRAESQIDEMDESVTKRIEECRNTLLIHEFENEYLKKHLDTSFTDKELKNYYDANLENFELKQNIFKGMYVKIPKDAPKQEKVKAWINGGVNSQELKSYCIRFSNHYQLEDTVWVNFDELVKNSPFGSISDKAGFLEQTRFAEKTDDNFLYLLKIKDYKISKQISPFEFVRDQIRNTLLNKRKIKLINDLKTTIYKEAKENNEFTIHKPY